MHADGRADVTITVSCREVGVAAVRAAQSFGMRARCVLLPALCDDAAFYSVVRRRLAEHLRRVGCPAGGPTAACCAYFWASFVAWGAAYVLLYASGTACSHRSMIAHLNEREWRIRC